MFWNKFWKAAKEPVQCLAMTSAFAVFTPIMLWGSLHILKFLEERFPLDKDKTKKLI